MDSNSLKNCEKYHFFFGSESPFSQWHPSPFKINDIMYANTEQYMMAEKARLFNDLTTCAQILATTKPYEIKRLGRVVKNFDEAKWCLERERIVYEGNLAKFSQNKKLFDFICQSDPSIIVEASPYDKIWGIGLDKSHPDSSDPSKWKGLNLLGKCLMTVRDII